MEESIFTKIIKGEIPCHKVYEDERTLAFLDIHPVQTGQVVVVPKVQRNFIWDLDHEDYLALMHTVQKTGQRLREIFTDKSRIGVMVEGMQTTDHAHVVLMPFNTSEEFRGEPNELEPDHAALADLAKKLAF
jgi:histidine triad (HIT) family protein